MPIPGVSSAAARRRAFRQISCSAIVVALFSTLMPLAVAEEPTPEPSPSVSEPQPAPSAEASPTPDALATTTPEPQPDPEVSPTPTGAPATDASLSTDSEPSTSTSTDSSDIQVDGPINCTGTGLPRQVGTVCELANGIIDTVELTCPPADCADDLTDQVNDAVDDAIARVCPYGLSDCAGELTDDADGYVLLVQDIAASAVETVRRAACGSASPTTCVDRAVTTVTIVVDNAVNAVMHLICESGNSTDCIMDVGNGVVETVNRLISTIENTACGGDDVVTCANEQVAYVQAVASGAVAAVQRAACGLAAATTCVNQKVEIITDLVDSATGIVFGVICPQTGSSPECIAEVGNGVLETVNRLISTIENTACGGDDVVTCANEQVAYVQATVAGAVVTIHRVACGSDPTTACVDQKVAIISALVDSAVDSVFEIVCPEYGNSTDCPMEINDRVMETVSHAVGTVTDAACDGTIRRSSGPQDCIEMVAGVERAVAELVFGTLCGHNNLTPECLEEVTTRLTDLARSTLDAVATLACDSETYSSGVEECTYMLAELQRDLQEILIDVICNDTGAIVPECFRELGLELQAIALSTINALGTIACDSETTSTGIEECMAMVAETERDVRELVFGTLCPVTGESPECVHEITSRVLTAVGDICSQIPVAPGGTTTGLPPAVSACVTKAIGVSELALRNVCGSSIPATCLDNVVLGLDETLLRTCSLLPVDTDGGSTTGLPPGVSACVLAALGVVQLAMETACGSSQTATCLDNVLASADETLQRSCGLIPVSTDGGETTGLPPGAGACALKVLGVVATAMETICASAAATTCVENAVKTVDATLQASCGVIPVATDSSTTTGLYPGVATCVLKVLGVVELAMTTACGSTSPATCLEDALGDIQAALAAACRGLPLEDGDATSEVSPALETCLIKVLGAVELVMTSVCSSTDAGTCVGNVLSTLESLVTEACSALVGTESTKCVEQFLALIPYLDGQDCDSLVAQECVASGLSQVEALVYQVCGLPLPSDSPLLDDSLEAPVGQECLDKAAGVVAYTVVVACGSSPSPGCFEEVLSLLEAACGQELLGCQDRFFGAIDPLADELMLPAVPLDVALDYCRHAAGLSTVIDAELLFGRGPLEFAPGGFYCTDSGEVNVATVGDWPADVRVTSEGLLSPGEVGDAVTSDPSTPEFQQPLLEPIGADSRRPADPDVFAYSAIVYLQNGCTGFLLGNNTVATAAHCVYDRDSERWKQSGDVFVQQDGEEQYGDLPKYSYRCEVSRRALDANYVLARHRHTRWPWDYAVMKIHSCGSNSSSVEKRVGGFGLYMSSENWYGATTRLSGYPGFNDVDRPPMMTEAKTQWWGDGKIEEDHPNGYLTYTTDTSGGQSGAPVYGKLPLCQCIVAIGVHGGPTSSYFDPENRGARIHSASFRFYVEWKRRES